MSSQGDEVEMNEQPSRQLQWGIQPGWERNFSTNVYQIWEFSEPGEGRGLEMWQEKLVRAHTHTNSTGLTQRLRT